MTTRRTIPIANKPQRANYSCEKCPAYCCTYPLIEVGKRDIARIARHFELGYEQAEERFTKFDKEEKVRALRHRADEHFGTACQFLHRETRRCTIYEARPGACRDYPNGSSCGYYDFLKFEREHQGDEDFIATTND
jgi:Fe-S-cluster containining protein